MIIRKAVATDSADLAELASRMWSASAEDLTPEFAVLTTSPEAACFLAFDGDKAIGFSQCQLRHDYVDAAYRRSGVARALLSSCEEWARSVGCSEFASDCEIDNHDSLAWHMKNGFSEMGRTIWFAKKL